MRKVLGLLISCLIVSSAFLPFTKVDPGLDFAITFFDVDNVTTRRYHVGETVQIFAQIENTGTVTIDPYRLEAVFTIISPSGSEIDAGTDWNIGWMDPGETDLLEGSWTVPSDAELGWYAIKVVVTSKDTGLQRSKQKDDAFEIPVPNVHLRVRAYDGATDVGSIWVQGVGTFDLPADIYLENGQYLVVGSGGVFDGKQYGFDKWDPPSGSLSISDQTRPDITLTVSGEGTLTLVLFKWDFTLDVYPTSQIVKQGDGAQYEVTVTATGGWTTDTGETLTVFVDILGLPSGTDRNFAGDFSLSQSDPNETYTAIIYTSENDTPPDMYQIIFKGTIISTTTTHSQTVELMVKPKEGALPDLIVEDFWWSPENPQPGDEVTFTYVETNQGEGDASAHRNTLLIDDYPISNDVVEALATGATRTRTFPDTWVRTAGGHEFLVKVDDQNVVTESDEENNVLKKPFDKDAVSTDLTVALDPSIIQPNTKVSITISGRLTRSDTGAGIAERPIGLDWTGGMTTTTTDDDGYYLYATNVGPYGEGAISFSAKFEGYETASTIFLPSNGSNTLQVTEGAPDLTITNISWNPSEPIVDDSVTFSYIVENQGTKGTTGFTNALYIDGERIDISTSKSLATGETQTGSFAYAWTATEGSHEIEVVADDLDEIIESDNINNAMSKTLEVGPAADVLSFHVVYREHYYDVSLWVPRSIYKDTPQKIENIVSWYPNIERSTLEHAYYLRNHVESPNGFPILKVSAVESGQLILEKELKTEILNGLLKYCYELFGAAWPDMLNNYETFGQQWLKAYEDSTWTVRASDAVSGVTNLLTIVGPIIGTIKDLYGGTTSERVKETVSLVFELSSGYDALVENYGNQKANAIANILVSWDLISSVDYNNLELYQNIKKNPSIAVQAIEEIDSQVLEFELTSDALSIVSNFVFDLISEETLIGEFAQSAAYSLYAYFGSGLTASTATAIGASAILESFVGYAIPIALASAISEGYIMPTAKALHAAWEDMKYQAGIYSNMHAFGLNIANSKDNTFSLANVEEFASLYGMLKVSEYHYYMNSYFYRSRQRFVPKSELDGYKQAAENAFSHAKEWVNTLENIYSYAEAIVNSVDPEGSTFNFTLMSPINVLPVVPENSSSFALIVNSTSGILLTSGSYVFSVQNRTWFSNFTYSLYVDDSNGSSYIIIFNPPEGQYKVETPTETSMLIVNIKPSEEDVELSTAHEVTATDLYFNVSASSVSSEPTPFLWSMLLILGGTIIVAISVAITLTRRKKRLQKSRFSTSQQP